MAIEELMRQSDPDAPCGDFELLPGMGDPDRFGISTVSSREERRQREENFRKCIQVSYVRGMQKGLEEADSWRRKAAGEVMSLSASIKDATRTFRVELDKCLLDLVAGMAAMVVKHEISENVRVCLKGQIEACLELMDRELPVRIRLNPLDADLLDELLSGDSDLAGRLADVKVVRDQSVDRGGCIMETARRALHATISGQLEQLKKILEKEYGKSVEEEMDQASNRPR